MAYRSAIANGNWGSLSTWDNSAVFGLPTASDAVLANGFNVSIDQSFEVNLLSNSGPYIGIAAAPQIDIAPVMTSNNAPSGICSASVNAATAFQVFDNTAATTWVGSGASGWISYQTATPNTARSYHIFVGSVTTASPRNWTFEGSNDGSSWTTLDTRTGILQSVNAWASYTPTSTGSFTYYRLNVTAINGGTNVTVYEFRPSLWAVVAAGGSFIFNSGSISGSATSTTAALTAGATNLIQVTAATGSVGLTLGSAVAGLGIIASQIILHSGNCNFNLSGVTFTGGSANPAYCIGKSSTGTITVTGNLVGGGGAVGNTAALFSNSGNTVVTGNIVASNLSVGIQQTAGNLTVNGNITAGTGTGVVGISLTGAASQFTIIGNVTGGSATSAFGINHSGTSGSVIGNVTGGSGASAHGINTVGAVTVTGTVTGGAGSGASGINTTNILTVTGNVLGNIGAGIGSSNNATVIGNITAGSTQVGLGVLNTTANLTFTITGTVAASSTIVGIGVGGGTGNQVVNLTGNMINVSGRQAIYAQNLFISNAATSQWRLFTQGGQDKTLYSADTFPNQPTSANVRSGSLFGPANALSGSMVVPVPSDVRVNVLTDNTVGTGQSLTAADFLAAISSSADPFAQRLRNVATVDTVGSLVTGLNGGF